MKLKNKKVIITGSSAGIGLATASLFLKEGAYVVINGSSDNGKKVCADLKKKYGERVIFIKADVSKMEDVNKLYKETLKKFKDIDILINCAGIVPEGTVLDVNEEEYDKAFDINVKGAFFLSKLVSKYFLEKGEGNIINVGSIAGIIGPKNRALYSATKGALISLTRAMASDFADKNIRVNCVCPGMVHSPSLQKRIDASKDPKETLKNFKNNIPIKRIGDAKEIATTILFMASDENKFMTGSIINVDGGASL